MAAPDAQSGSRGIPQTPEQNRNPTRDDNNRTEATLSDVLAAVAQTYPDYGGEWARNLNLLGNGNLGRVPMVMATETMVAQGRYLLFYAGPDNAQWDFKMRGSVQETASGTIQHYFKDPLRNTFFNEPEITFGFQSGTILPIRITDRQAKQAASTAAGPGLSPASFTVTALPFGLLNFYEFLELLDQKKTQTDGRINPVYILYSSNVFPRIILRGYFLPNGTQFTENMEGADVKWTSTFKVMSTYPRFQSADSLARSWREIQTFRGYEVSQAGSAFTRVPNDQTPSGA